MTHRLATFVFIGTLGASTVFAQAMKTPDRNPGAAEISTTGTILHVVSAASPDGTVGVHLDLKTPAGLVRVHLGPALYIGMNNFFFQADEAVHIAGTYVVHDGDVGLWARQITKEGRTLTLRNLDGTPRWTLATAEDPDGCGVSHAPIR